MPYVVVVVAVNEVGVGERATHSSTQESSVSLSPEPVIRSSPSLPTPSLPLPQLLVQWC